MVARALLRAELRHGARGHLMVVALLAGVAAALTLAAVVGRLANDPWERTWRATGAAHLTVFGDNRNDLSRALALVPGITASSGPTVAGFAGLHAGGWHVETQLVERPAGARGPGRAVVVEGSDAGGVLLERSFARRLGVSAGDKIAFDAPAGRRPVRVSGLVVVSDQEPYPFGQPGLAFGTRALLDAVVAPGGPRFLITSLRLADPLAASSVEARLRVRCGRTGCPFSALSWQTRRAIAGRRLENPRIALLLLSAMLILCAAAIVGTLVSERILARARELAILRAAGLTPGGLVVLTGVLYGALGAAGGLLGLGAGTLLGPLVAGASEELVAAPGMVGPAPAAAVAVAAGTAALAALAAALPTWLLARRPAAAALAVAAGGARRRPSRLARVARRARLPVPAVLGAGEAFARRPRATLAILALALSIAAVVGAVAMEVDSDSRGRAETADLLRTTAASGDLPFDHISSADATADQLRSVVYPGVSVLLALALGNLVAVLALALREGRRDAGILRAVGLTPREAAWTVTSRELVIALVAVVPGVPLGLGLWRLGVELAGGTSREITQPSALLLLAVALATLAAVALVTAPLARSSGRVPVTDVLRQE